MIEKNTFTFLQLLRQNNHKEWFEANRKIYEQARSNFIDVTDRLIEGISAFDEDIAHSNLKPRNCIMRINRDIRFSKDKKPYKSNFFCFINKAGRKSPFAGYYLSIDPGGSFHGGGIYLPENPVLSKIRQEIDYNFNEWLGVVNDDNLKSHYDEVKPSGILTRPPKGYDKDNPAIQWIKYKGYYTQKMLDREDVLSDTFVEETIKSYRSIKPMVDFINRSLKEV